MLCDCYIMAPMFTTTEALIMTRFLFLALAAFENRAILPAATQKLLILAAVTRHDDMLNDRDAVTLPWETAE